MNEEPPGEEPESKKANQDSPLLIESRFELGHLVMTRGVAAEIDQQDMIEAIRRHARCDWGDVCEEDWQHNEWSLKNAARLVSVYKSARVKFYIITEADRSATTVLLPEEY